MKLAHRSRFLPVLDAELDRERSRICEAWVDTLSRWRWDWFLTLTFRRGLTSIGGVVPERAERLWRVFVRAVDEQLAGIYYGPFRDSMEDWPTLRAEFSTDSGKLVRPRCWWVLAMEPHRSGKVHLHALMGGPGLDRLRKKCEHSAPQRDSDGMVRCCFMHRWEALAGFSRIYEPREAEAVRAYCAKYTAKGGDLELGGALTSPWA